MPNASALRSTPRASGTPSRKEAGVTANLTKRFITGLVGIAAGLVLGMPVAIAEDSAALWWFGICGVIAGAVCGTDRTRIGAALVGAIAAGMTALVARAPGSIGTAMLIFAVAGAAAGSITGTRWIAIAGAVVGFVVGQFSGVDGWQLIGMVLGAVAGLALGTWRDAQRKGGGA